MKKISVANTYFVVDNEDYEYMNRFKWLLRNGHPATTHKNGLYATQLIKPKTRSKRYLFKNNNPLDLRKHNIDIVDWGTSAAHSKKTDSNTSSIYKGVYYDKRRNRWIAYLTIRKNGKRIKLLYKSYKTEKMAAKKRDEVAKQHFGEYAYQNGVEL